MKNSQKEKVLNLPEYCLRSIQNVYDLFCFESGKELKLPERPTPEELLRLIRELEVDDFENARQLSLAILHGPFYQCLDYLERECPLSLQSRNRINGEMDFIWKWKEFLSKPIKDEYVNFVCEVFNRELVDGVELWNKDTVLVSEFSPHKKMTYAEAYEFAIFISLGSKYKNYKSLIMSWIARIEQLFKKMCRVPEECIDELRRSVIEEFKLKEHNRRGIKLGRHESAYAIDQISAAKILLNFAGKLRQYPYKVEYAVALISYWTALGINNPLSNNSVEPSEVRAIFATSNISKEFQRFGSEKMNSVSEKLINLFMSIKSRKKIISKLTNDIIRYQINTTFNSFESENLGRVSENCLKSFPHPLGVWRIPHDVVQDMRVKSETKKMFGRQLLSILEIPCLDIIRGEICADFKINND